MSRASHAIVAVSIVLFFGLIGCNSEPSRTLGNTGVSDAGNTTDARDTRGDEVSGSSGGSSDAREDDEKAFGKWDDTDGDGHLDRFDNCRQRANPDQKDTDGDHVGDVCDNCPNVANQNQQDSNGNGVGDACEGVNDPQSDPDGDGIPTGEDNCPGQANPDQKDTDGDGVGDACDNCKQVANHSQQDSNGDGTGDACEDVYDPSRDRDGDGVSDVDDNCPDTPNPDQKDPDNDRLGNPCDNCDEVANYAQADSNDDGTGDACTREPVGQICSTKSANFKQVKPNLYFVIDRSSSMTNNDGTGESRMRRAKAGLDKIADRLHDEARFGMSTYPCTRRRNACGDMNKEFLSIGDYSRQQIRNAYRAPNFDDGTCPWGDARGLDGLDVETGGKHLTETGAALDDVRKRELYQDTNDSLASERKKRVVLITDGNACGCGDNGCGGHQKRTLDALRKLRNNKGIKTHVVGFNYSSNLLNDAARAGGTDAVPSGSRRFYRARNATTLADALEKISGKVISCSYELQQPKDQIDANRIWVEVGGDTVDRSQFGYNPRSKTLTLEAQTCQRLKQLRAGQSSEPLKILLGCPKRCQSDGSETCNYKDDDCDGKIDEDANCGSPEICGDETDNDNDGRVDEGCPDGSCTPTRETCNGEDDDCDGTIDESCPDCQRMGEACGADQPACCGSASCQSDGTCGILCRPNDTNCRRDEQCCSGICQGGGGGNVGTCRSG